MLTKIKETIKELAFSAVNYAENALSTQSGKEKKRAAIEFVVTRLPFPQPFKSIIGLLLSKIIDAAIENSVEYVKTLKKED
jgi:hypothetical protein